MLLIEHPPTLLRALRESLSSLGLDIVGAARSLDRGLDLIARLNPDLVVLDAEIADMDAVHAIKTVRERAPGISVIVLTLEPDRFANSSGVLPVGKVGGAPALLAAVRDAMRRASR